MSDSKNIKHIPKRQNYLFCKPPGINNKMFALPQSFKENFANKIVFDEFDGTVAQFNNDAEIVKVYTYDKFFSTTKTNK